MTFTRGLPALGLLGFLACRTDVPADTGAKPDTNPPDTAADTATDTAIDTATDSGGDSDPTPLTRTLGEQSLPSVAVRLTGPPGGTVGRAIVGGDLDGDGLAELLIGAPGANGGDGALYVVADGLSASRALDSSEERVQGGGGARLGWAVAVADLDGDGLLDLIAGAPRADGEAEGSGAAYAWRSPLTGIHTSRTAWASVLGEAEGDQLGAVLQGIGDLDSDGTDDLLLTAWAYDGAGADAGVMGVFASLKPGSTGMSGADRRLAGELSGQRLGYAAAGRGDLEGDGFPDLAVGAPGVDLAGIDSGAAYFWSHPALGTTPLSSTARLAGTNDYDEAAASLAFLPDSNGDSTDELILGAPGSDTAGTDAGAVYFVTTASGAGLTAPLYGAAPGDGFGSAVSGLGDVDGDGFGDALIGAWQAGGDDSGAAWLLYGPVDAAYDLAFDAARFAATPGEAVGYSVAAPGDIDGDRLPDLALGAPGAEDGAGAVYLVRGGS